MKRHAESSEFIRKMPILERTLHILSSVKNSQRESLQALWRERLLFELTAFLSEPYKPRAVLLECHKILIPNIIHPSELAARNFANLEFALVESLVRSRSWDKALLHLGIALGLRNREELVLSSFKTPEQHEDLDAYLLRNGVHYMHANWLRNCMQAIKAEQGSYSPLTAWSYVKFDYFPSVLPVQLRASLQASTNKAWNETLNRCRDMALSLLNSAGFKGECLQPLHFFSMPSSPQPQLQLPILFLYLCYLSRHMSGTYNLSLAQDTLISGAIREDGTLDEVDIDLVMEAMQELGFNRATLPEKQILGVHYEKHAEFAILPGLETKLLYQSPLSTVKKRKTKKSGVKLAKRILGAAIGLILSCLAFWINTPNSLHGGYRLIGTEFQILTDRGEISARVKLPAAICKKQIIPLCNGNYFLAFHQKELLTFQLISGGKLNKLQSYAIKQEVQFLGAYLRERNKEQLVVISLYDPKKGKTHVWMVSTKSGKLVSKESFSGYRPRIEDNADL